MKVAPLPCPRSRRSVPHSLSQQHLTILPFKSLTSYGMTGLTTRQSGEKLLDFIKSQHNHFEKLSKQTPEPQPKVPFDHSYDAACGSLQSWIDYGCDPGLTRAPSEYIADVAKWVNYAG